MPKIDQEIEEMAKSAEESVMTPKEQLMKTIKELGPEGVKAKIDLLTKSEKEVLNDALEEMKKSASPAMDKDYAASYHKGDVYNKTVIQEDKADDDADEKLVKPANAKMKNQGDNAPEGIEGQVIKSVDKKEVKKIAEKEADDRVDEHNKKLHAGEVKKSDIDIADDADETADEAVGKVKGDSKADKKVMGKNYSMKKSKEELIEMKKSIEAEMIAKGEEPTAELVKGKIKELLAEADQSKDKMDDMQKDPVRGDKARPEALKVEEENKAAQDKVDDKGQGQMKKSIDWADKNALLKSDRGGRNHNFSVNGYYDEALAKAEPKKEGEEDLKKSESEVKDYDLNDLIEKDMTTTWKELDTANGIAKSMNEANGQLVKSFETNEIAQALGLSEEEAKKILGE